MKAEHHARRTIEGSLRRRTYLYSAENQRESFAENGEGCDVARSAGFEEHLEQTKRHVARLQTIFEKLDESPTGKKCKGMEGLIEEGSGAIEEHEGEILDAALIGAAQRVEHYEIAGYGTVIAFAEELGESEHVSLLNETLTKEKETDEKLTELAGNINAKANQSGKDDEEIKKAGKKKSRNAA